MTPEGWSRATVGEVTTCCDYGLSCSLSTEPSGIPVLRMGNLRDGSLDTTDLKFVPADKVKATDLLSAGDILVNRTNSAALVGKIGLFTSTRSMTFASYLFRMRTEVSKAAPEWLAAVLSSPRYQATLRDIATPGVSQANINRERLRSLELAVPPLGEQKKIAAILSSVDAAIEASQAVIDQLGAVKKAMMAELLTRGLPGRHTRFKQTEIGEVPAEWELVKLGSVVEKLTDGEHLSPKLRPTGHPILSAKHVREDAVVFDDYGLVSSEDFAKFRKRCDPNPGDVLIVSRGATIGRVNFLRSVPKPFALMGSVIQVRSRAALVSGEFLAAYLELERTKRALVRTSGSSAQQAIYLAHIKDLAVPRPPIAEQERIASMCQRFAELIAAEREALAAQRRVKSALMSVLLTGEVRVRPDEDEAA